MDSVSTSVSASVSASANASANRCDFDPRYNFSIPRPLQNTYACIEIACALIALVGNLLVLFVFVRCRSLRTVTNYYVISLAVADTLVATVGVPSAILTSVGLPRDFHLCLLMNSVLMMLCTGSILSLVAVTVDRFWAIVHPLTYAADMTKRRAKFVIACCWILAAIIGLLPVAGWYRCVPPEPRCFFREVMDFRYLAFVYFATIICPVLFMAMVYIVIYRAVRLQVSLTRAASKHVYLTQTLHLAQ
jgi:adenosine receptor A2a